MYTKAAFVVACVFLNISVLIAQTNAHPRIYTTNDSKDEFLQRIKDVAWKKSFVEKKTQNLEKYLKFCQNDPNWLVSRLQMNWKTKHSKVFLDGGNFSYSSGKAPVPTVRFSGTRDWATDYKQPKLENVIPYLDDPRGVYLEHKKTGKKEWVHPSKSGHSIEGINRKVMSLVEDAAFLYWVTGDKKYAEFATPVFLKYIEGMYHRDAPIDIKNSNQQRISGLATFEVIHEKILLHLVTTYDFLFNYFKKEKIDLSNAVAVFQKWGDQIIVNGIPDNNWNLFQARFLTYVALVLEPNENYKNGKGREYFLEHTFDKSTERQLSIKESLLVYDQETGMWPECASYSTHVITSLLEIITLLDNFTNTNELSNFPIIEKAALASFQYLFPSGYIVGFGDSAHKIIPPKNFELLISNYEKYKQEEKELLISGLLHTMLDEGKYKRKTGNLFELFFYVDKIKKDETNKDKAEAKKLISPTFYASNVSMFNQRLGQGDNAVMVSTVGSYGNHSHVNGISIELFANKYVLGPDMGKGSSYWHSDHREYYSRFPAHNTVVVDGASDYDAMRGYHPFELDNYFPELGETPIFDKITFSKVSFFEPKTKSNQQRFTAIIKSNSNKNYIVDIFRSKKQEPGKQRHDYFYHNLGQSLQIFQNKNELKLSKTDDFGSHQGDIKGYDYLTDKTKIETPKDVQAQFQIESKESPNNVMKIWVKGNEDQSVYSVKSPKSKATSSGTAPKEIVNNPMATLILKREAAAWENPFALVFNPYIEGTENPIENVTYLNFKDNPETQVIDVLLSDKTTVDRMVLNTTENDAVKNGEFYQKGLFSIARQLKNKNSMDFLFVSGMYKYEQNGWEIISSGDPVTISFENIESGYQFQNNAPALIRIPFLNNKKSAEIRLYKGNKLLEVRQAVMSRYSKQIEFRLSEAYEKGEVVFK
ncbi:heparinase II/III family protein [Flavivirga aquimarina]|uniref:Heparinase II/III family protein n=1 Tax=Flavivirga aquimarina TaxID=2027862 RepID=A0ABT8WF49_9FLAO|nr:heparinase II/III family protein [Flavivirga aquimarina]MDO5971766.1 heparinase II/III family protein [Flavivirga aquimarina]